ncbi:ribosomal RNA small subunit methyltransferase A [Candidatus Saccharibacteria bacterium]|nr:ribosomal RNA small subunit methyltransferase A [Candidatus Saccharibacteria bacterium]
MKAKKSFGQNWLKDDEVIEEIIKSANITDQDTILEVGPGLGALTRQLIKTKANIVAVEADAELIPRLQRMFQDSRNFQLVPADILKYDYSLLPKGYKVVANIPYYLTSKLIRNFLESSNKPSEMTLMVQKEVAERIVAGPGKMSVLSFSVQYYATAQVVLSVPKEFFEPIPKVDSAVIKIVLLAKPLFSADSKKLFRLVKAGFGEKRKMLHNSLAGGLDLTPNDTTKLLQTAKLSPPTRAQELSMQDWDSLLQSAIALGLI